MSDTSSSDLYKKREKIQPLKVAGFFQQLRITTLWLTMGWFFIAPWLSWHNRQAILFDLPHRKFYVFAVTFWPQDFFLLSWIMIIAALALLFVTMIAGRVWCGYTCPQTAWTKVFMWIEEITEGSRYQRLRLDKQQFSLQKLLRRGAKHLAWIIVSLATAFTFVGFFTPIPVLQHDFITLTAGPWEIFWISFFTLATYINAGWMREQICLYMCPYARFQGSMFDRNTLVISYDEKRGEPRGSRKRNEDPESSSKGDCINCTQCVQVCPTGIDIRDGLQIECIGCAACIDACDNIMDKMNYPRGLVRYSTENSVSGKKTKLLRPRVIATGLILLTMVGAFAYTLYTRIPLRVDVMRERAQLFRHTVDGKIENGYTLKIINMSQSPEHYTLTVSGLPGLKLLGQSRFSAKPGEIMVIPVSLQIAPSRLLHMNNPIEFTVQAINAPKQITTTKDRFIGPSRR